MNSTPTIEEFVETWKGISVVLGRSERWCRYMAARAGDPLPVYKLGGIVRLNLAELRDWLGRQRREPGAHPAPAVVPVAA